MRRHYDQHLGEPLETVAIARGVRVLAYRAPYPEDLVLVTDGLRDLPAPPAQQAIELLMLAPATQASTCAATLVDLAHYPWERDAPLHWFHVLPLGMGIVPGSPLTSVLLTMPWLGTADFFSRLGDRRVDVVQVIPITEVERALFVARGLEALEGALEEVDLTDLGRASVA